MLGVGRSERAAESASTPPTPLLPPRRNAHTSSTPGADGRGMVALVRKEGLGSNQPRCRAATATRSDRSNSSPQEAHHQGASRWTTSPAARWWPRPSASAASGARRCVRPRTTNRLLLGLPGPTGRGRQGRDLLQGWRCHARPPPVTAPRRARQQTPGGGGGGGGGGVEPVSRLTLCERHRWTGRWRACWCWRWTCSPGTFR